MYVYVSGVSVHTDGRGWWFIQNNENRIKLLFTKDCARVDQVGSDGQDDVVLGHEEVVHVAGANLQVLQSAAVTRLQVGRAVRVLWEHLTFTVNDLIDGLSVGEFISVYREFVMIQLYFHIDELLAECVFYQVASASRNPKREPTKALIKHTRWQYSIKAYLMRVSYQK